MKRPVSAIHDRIAAAFGNGARSDDVAALIMEAEAAAASASQTADRARARALDPALSASELAEARRSMEDAAFARERLAAAVPKLQERLAELRKDEEDGRRWVAYDKARAERDRLAGELARVYPPIVEQLTDLLARIDANDQEIEYTINPALPSDAKASARGRAGRSRPAVI
jgi:hypothetical protein